VVEYAQRIVSRDVNLESSDNEKVKLIKKLLENHLEEIAQNKNLKGLIEKIKGICE